MEIFLSIMDWFLNKLTKGRWSDYQGDNLANFSKK